MNTDDRRRLARPKPRWVCVIWMSPPGVKVQGEFVWHDHADLGHPATAAERRAI